MAFSAQQIATLWIQYGGDPAAASMAAAIALAESSGNPQAFNSKDPNGGSVGLFQINGVHGSDASTDVATNVQAAIRISRNGTNWRPWSTYTSGKYLLYLPMTLGISLPSANSPADPGAADTAGANWTSDGILADVSSSGSIALAVCGILALGVWAIS